jgi:hypothetical protein
MTTTEIVEECLRQFRLKSNPHTNAGYVVQSAIETEYKVILKALKEAGQ